MKLSFNWLSDYVDLSGLTPEQVAEKLTMGAFEVEEIKYVGPKIEGDVVVGEILEINPHPQADKIRITKTRVAPGEEPRQIVCGAWNIEVGHRIPVALPGAVVINRHDGTELPIKESKIRGEVSKGMLCSPGELGLQGNDGILILPADTEIGASAKQLLNLIQEAVLVVEPRSNRGDALSVIGLAREVAALFGRPLKQPDWKLPAAAEATKIDVRVENTEDCSFFTARVIGNLKPGPAPEWMVKRLEAVGMRSVSNIVDVTNYVMLELGQPLHAYDARKVKGGLLETRRAKQGEKLVTINEKEHELTAEVLVIADNSGPIGVAGVMGGKGSEIGDDSTEVILEAAGFNSARVRRSSRLLGLSSDSSLRFERGVDIASVQRASDRAAFLLVTECGGTLGSLSTSGSDQVAEVKLSLRLSQITRLTELKVSPEEAEKLLTPLGFTVEKKDADNLVVSVPSFRQKDVTREIDLVEEITRLYGYDKVPMSMPKNTVAPPLPNKAQVVLQAALSAAGLSEAWTSSLASLEDLSARGSFEGDDSLSVRVLNPLSEDHQVLRQSLIPGLLKAVAYNHDHGTADVWLFETGRVYLRDPQIAVEGAQTGTREPSHIAAAISGQRLRSGWKQEGQASGKNAGSRPTDFYVLKGVLENMLEWASVPSENIYFSTEEAAPQWFHPSRSSKVVFKYGPRDKREPIALGWLGEVHPAVAEAYGLKKTATVFELNIGNISGLMQPHKFHEIYPTPIVQRDLTADVPKSTEQSSLMSLIRQIGGKLLQDVDLVSVFDLSDEQKSLSYRLKFQHPEQTLTAEEVEEVMTKVRGQLAKQLSVSFRI